MERARDIGDKVRVQFDLIPARVEEIERLMLDCGLETRKDLINNALTLLEWAVGEVKNGNEVASLNRASKRYEILRMPILAYAARVGNSMEIISAEDIARKQRRAVASESTDVSSDTDPTPFSHASM